MNDALDTIRYVGGRPLWYKLAEDGRTPVPATLRETSAWLEDVEARRVAFTHLGLAGHVSTVFLTADHGHLSGKPVLFETMVFGGRLDGLQVRATSWAKAHGNHQQIVSLVCRTMKPQAKRLRGYLILGHRYNRGSNSSRGISE